MIPNLDPVTGRLPFVDEEPYWTTVDAVEARFASGVHRRRLWDGFLLWLEALDEAGMPGDLRLGGSFLSDKVSPSDIDVAVSLHPDQMSVAAGIIKPKAHLWTWQDVHVRTTDGEELRKLVQKLKPMLGRVDAYFFRVGGAQGELWASDWTSAFDSDGVPTGARHGWLGVRR